MPRTRPARPLDRNFRDRRCPWPAPAVVLLGVLAASASASAFHDGGVAPCSGCHQMHDSRDGIPVAGGPLLLLYESATDVCLSCHATANGSVLGLDPRNPPPELGAGNFAFLLEDNLNDAPDGAFQPIAGHRAGHSIVSASRGLAPDPELTVAPGGTFPSSDLECTSCHDPHGSSSFRMLRGAGSELPGGFTFLYDAPQAEGIADLVGPESPTSHTAYRGGWTDWCANCHGLSGPHDSGGDFEHPVDQSLGDEWMNYNAYDGPSNPTGGSFATAYLPETPIEDPALTADGTEGARGSSRISCMSCHRAHATSAPAALRWDPNVLRLDDDGTVSLSYPIPDPYHDPEQRALCVKCHYPVAVDHGMDQPCMSCHGPPAARTGLFERRLYR